MNASIPLLTGHAAHVAKIGVIWRRIHRRNGKPADLAESNRVFRAALAWVNGGAR